MHQVFVAYCASLHVWALILGNVMHGVKSYVDDTGALFLHLSNIFLLHRLQTCTHVLSLSPHLLWYVFKLKYCHIPLTVSENYLNAIRFSSVLYFLTSIEMIVYI